MCTQNLSDRFSRNSHADDAEGLTWGGRSYETSDARANGTETTETGAISAGVDIRDTEVVLLTFIRVGTGYNKRNCHLNEV